MTVLARYLNYFMTKPLNALLCSLALFAALPLTVLAADAVFTQKCGECHARSDFASVQTNSEWSNLPLRTWLDNHHQPRLHSVSLTTAEVVRIQNHINGLRTGSGRRLYEAVDTQIPSSTDDAELHEENFAPVEILDNEGSKLITKPQEGMSDCLNC